MARIVPLEPGMFVRLKKTHPCGGNVWEILRGGIDVKIRCTKCGRVVTVNRQKFHGRIKEFIIAEEQ